MKQHTTPEQTAKLIELGFAPKMRIKGVCTKYGTVNVEHEAYFDIGELIGMLPKEITNVGLTDSLSIYTDHNKMWAVEYSNVLGNLLSTYRTELVDALYDMIVKLKEEGVI